MMNEDVRRIIAGISMHMEEIKRLRDELEKRYGIRMISADALFIEAQMQVRNGFKELHDYLDGGEIKGFQNHWGFDFGDIHIVTVTDGGKRFRKAARRRNKWTAKKEKADEA